MKKWALIIQGAFVAGIILNQFVEIPYLIAKIGWVLLGSFQVIWTIIRGARSNATSFKIAFFAFAFVMLFIPFFPEIWTVFAQDDPELLWRMYLNFAPPACFLLHLSEWLIVKEEEDKLPEMEGPEKGGFMFIDEDE